MTVILPEIINLAGTELEKSEKWLDSKIIGNKNVEFVAKIRLVADDLKLGVHIAKIQNQVIKIF